MLRFLLPPLGTTHADYYYGEIPCTRTLNRKKIERAYEPETGNVIIGTFAIAVINNDTNTHTFTNELRWNEVVYR